MNYYTEKEKKIIKQSNEGPFFSLITKLTNDEFDIFASKLIEDDNYHTLGCLASIYCEYNRNKIIDYFIDKKDTYLLLSFLDLCYDFSSSRNTLDQKYIIDKILEKNDIKFVKEIIESDYLYFLTDKKQKQRLIDFIA